MKYNEHASQMIAHAHALAGEVERLRALLAEAQDVIYDGRPNATRDIDLLRRIDAALTAAAAPPPPAAQDSPDHP